MNTYRAIQTDSDKEKAIRLWTLRSKIMRTPQLPEQLKIDIESGTTFGAFDEADKLMVTLRVAPIGPIPARVLCDLFTRPSFMQTYTFYPGHPACELFDMAIEHMEADGIYNWYYSRAIAPAYDKIQKNGKDLLSQTRLGHRYDRYVQEIIKAGERSRFPLHDLLVKHQTYKHNVMVVECMLRNEFREIGEVFIRAADFYA